MSHPYFLALDIRDFDGQSDRPTRRTGVVNIYDNRVGQGYTWEGETPGNRRAIEDVMWDRVIWGRVLLLGDVNAHSPVWNLHCQRRKNAKPLEDLIERFDLLINNESGRTTRPASTGVSVIDLALSTVELGFRWEIPEEYPSLSDNELILLRWDDVSYNSPDKAVAEPTDWDLKCLMGSADDLKSAHVDWIERSKGRNFFNHASSCKDLDEEMEWLEKNLTKVFDTHAKILRVTSFSKRWWNEDVAKARKTWAKEKRKWGSAAPDAAKLKQARNLFYRVIRKAKLECWQSFLEGKKINGGMGAKESVKDRCWTALRYTQPRQCQTTPALKGPNDEVAITMYAKEALVRAHAFPKLPIFPGREIRPAQGPAHTLITIELVEKALFCRSTTKASGPDKFNFLAIRLLWSWDSERILAIVKNATRLHYHPTGWKRARGILLEKGYKRDKSLVKSYRVISLLNCLGKLVEKVVAVQLSVFCEANRKLHVHSTKG